MRSPLADAFRRAAACAPLMLIQPCVHACFINKYEFNAHDSAQTTAYRLINEHYLKDADRPRGFWAEELRGMEAVPADKRQDPDFLDDYAYVLFRNGREKESEKIWKSLLDQNPDRYSSICSYGTMLHNMGRFDEASALLERATKIKPGFRNGAEELHIRMIDFQSENRKSAEYGKSHLFVDEMSAAWLARKPPPGAFSKVTFPRISKDGLAELLRQFPQFGDAWLVLGMYYDQEGENHLARRSYERAVKTFTTQREAIQSYLRPFSAYESQHNTVADTGRGIATLIATLVGGFIFYKVFRKSAEAYNDIREARMNREEEKRRRERGR